MIGREEFGKVGQQKGNSINDGILTLASGIAAAKHTFQYVVVVFTNDVTNGER